MMNTAYKCPEEQDKEHKAANRPLNSSDPKPIKHPWDALEQVQSMEGPTWIRFGSDQLRHGLRTSGGALGCLAPGCWWQILGVQWVAR